MSKKYIIDPKEFDLVNRVDLEYINEFRKKFIKTKKTLPHFLDFNGYKIKEDNKYFNL